MSAYRIRFAASVTKEGDPERYVTQIKGCSCKCKCVNEKHFAAGWMNIEAVDDEDAARQVEIHLRRLRYRAEGMGEETIEAIIHAWVTGGPTPQRPSLRALVEEGERIAIAFDHEEEREKG